MQVCTQTRLTEGDIRHACSLLLPSSPIDAAEPLLLKIRRNWKARPLLRICRNAPKQPGFPSPASPVTADCVTGYGSSWLSVIRSADLLVFKSK